MNSLNIKRMLLIIFIITGLIACGADVGGNEDKTSPTVTLTSLNNGEEVIGTYNVTWTTDDPNPSTVDIYLSRDSGKTYPTAVGINIPDTGSYSWDTNIVDDCRNCRLRIIPQDVVGNVGEPVESAEDFIINNVPQVLGVAYYYDLDNNGFDGGDEIRVPFDKELEIRTSIASDIFFFPVLGDNIGAFSKVRKGTDPKELIITMNDIDAKNNYRLHIGGTFNTGKLGLTFPSGINLQDNISEGVIFSPDTGRTAMAAEQGIDILPAFTDSNQALGNRFTEAIALGDVDGDGDLDMLTGNNGTSDTSDTNRLWLNDGKGYFIDSGQALGRDTSIVLGDVDGDGDLDIVTSSSVWLNGGTGIFTNHSLALGRNTSIALGDVDGDGDLDIVAGNRGVNKANTVWLNGGDNSGSNTGVFTDSGQTLGNSNTRSIVLGDLDGDGDLDIVAGNNGANRVWLNEGINTGSFTITEQMLGNNDTTSIALGDVNGDGNLDIVAGNRGVGVNEANTVWLNGGDSSDSNTGVFSDSGQALGNRDTQSIVLGDMDGDGDLDIVTGNDSRTSNRIWLNGGDSSGSNSGIFSDSGLTLGNNSTKSIALGDVDGDSDLDIVTGNQSFMSSNHIWINSLKFPEAPFIMGSSQKLGLGNSYTESIALGDIDGDGDLDMVTGNIGANYIWLNDGNGRFTNSDQSLGNSFTQSITLGDVDGDGDLDIATGNSRDNEASRLWLNNGKGKFTDSEQILSSGNITSIALGDVDGDDDLDLILNFHDRSNEFFGIDIRLNGGDNSGSNTGVFSSGNFLYDFFNYSIVIGDMDTDGDLDIAEVNFVSMDVWFNGGSSNNNTLTFTHKIQQTSVLIDPVSIALGDIDGDEDLDIVTGDNISTDRVWINDGKGEFSDSGQALGGSFAATPSIALDDMDGDGDLDIVTGNSGANLIFLNGGDNSGSNTGVFTDSGELMGSSETHSIALGDVDGDGDLDIVTGNNGPNRVWLNDF